MQKDLALIARYRGIGRIPIMSKCPKCGKPVYFAERKSSLGKEWHPQCLRCEVCDKTLTPGRHSEHLGAPYCNQCYQAHYGPDGFRPGSLEPRKVLSPDDQQTSAERQETLARIKEYNLYKDSPVDELMPREINGKVLFEGVLKIYWGLQKPIRLAPGITYTKQRYNRDSIYDFVGVDDASYLMMLEEAARVRKRRELTNTERTRLREIAEASVELSDQRREQELTDFSLSLPSDYGSYLSSGGGGSFNDRDLPDGFDSLSPSMVDPHDRFSASLDPFLSLGSSLEPGFGNHDDVPDGNTSSKGFMRQKSDDFGHSRSRSSVGTSAGGAPMRKRSASFRRISRRKKKEERNDLKQQKFTPPYGTSTNLRVASTIRTSDVIGMLLAKFKVQDEQSQFGLCVVYDSSFQEPCKMDDFPLKIRLKLGPSEDIAKIFIMETAEAEALQITAEVAEWIKFSLHELDIFDKKYEEELNKEEEKIRKKFEPMREAITDELNRHHSNHTVYHETDI